jgi:hypothetical protein
MARPQDEGGGDGLQIRKAAANIPNKQSCTADKGGTPAYELIGQFPAVKKPACYEMLRGVSDLEQPNQRKMDMRFGTWNARSLYRSGSLKTV